MKLFRGRIFASLIVLWGLTTAFALGQNATGNINGTVHERSGAVVPAATTILENVQTGVVRTVQTNNNGIYVFPSVLPGTYNLSVSKAGFQTSVRSDIPLTVNASISFDFTLSVSNVKTSVVVRANAETLNTQTAGLSTTITQSQVVGEPLNGRNFTALLITVPGASPITTSPNLGYANQPIGAYSYPSFNGQANIQTLFFIDGALDFGTRYNGAVINPIPDDISQLGVLNHTDDASAGGVLGGVVNVVTKGGTNEFHGAAWEFIQNDALDSKGPYVTTPKTPLHQNQFGFNVGGPIILPHYNGKRRTFFFGSLEEYRLSTASLSYSLVPTPAQLGGDFSGLLTQSVPAQLYNPFSTRPDPNNPGEYLRDPIKGNQMQGLLDAKAAALAKLMYPAPVPTPYPSNVANSIDTDPIVKNQTQYTYRIDETITDQDSIFVRYTKQRMVNISPYSAVSGSEAEVDPFGYNAVLSYQHLFGSRGLMHLLVGRDFMALKQINYNTRVNGSTMPSYFNPSFACGFALGYGPQKCNLPTLSIPDYPTVSDYNEVPQSVDAWQYQGDFSWLFGAHALRWGASFIPGALTDVIGGGSGMNYSAVQTSNLESAAGTGYGLASYLMGVPTLVSTTGAGTPTLTSTWTASGYAQDTWKVKSNFTVNLGLRYDFWHNGYLKQNGTLAATGNWDLTTGNYVMQVNPGLCSAVGKAPCIPGSGLPAHVTVSTQNHGTILFNNHRNIQPRIGLNYQMYPGTVLRAGYGRIYDVWTDAMEATMQLEELWPSASTYNNSTNQTTVDTLMENVTGPTFLPPANPYNQLDWYTEPHAKTPYSDQWNFGVEQRVTPDTTVTFDYVGSHDGNLDIGFWDNVAKTPGQGGNPNDRPFPYLTPTFDTSHTNRSSYNALQVTAKHRVGYGLTFLVSYAWSKSLDIGADGNYLADYAVRNPYNIDADKGPAGFNLPQNLVVSGVFQLPFHLENRFTNQLVHGWTLGGIISAHSGQNFTVILGVDNADIGNTFAPEDRPNLVGNPKLSHPIHGLGGGSVTWFNTSAFVAPPPLSHGDEGRNILLADPYTDFDLSLARDFPIFSDKRRLQFHIDAFNAGNFYQYGVPDATYGTPNFGTAIPAGNRVLQVAMKFLF
ncbi:MAG: carboxypeptidase-like regulatory domain-containing protein [Acidobacteriaceae bacterium]